MDQPGFFDVDERLARLSGLGDQLEAFFRAVDFEQFRPDVEKALAYADGSKDGRPPIDPVLMFKVLVIQTINTLSDERSEYLINDRLSFMRFLGLGLSDRAPDAKTIWLFRERLTKAGAITALFERFDAMLRGGSLYRDVWTDTRRLAGSGAEPCRHQWRGPKATPEGR